MTNKIAAGVPFFLEHEGLLYECEVEHKRTTWTNVRIKLHETKYINFFLFKIKKDVIAWEHFYSDYEELVDSGFFDEKYYQYRTNGDLNNIQLYADI